MIRNSRWVLVSCVAVACAPELSADDATSPGGKADSSDDTLDELEGKYGVRPRRYGGFFNRSNQAEEELAYALPVVTADINQRLTSRGFRFQVEPEEIAVNFIAEGGYYALEDNRIGGLTGCDLGLLMLVDDYPSLKPWMSDSLRSRVESGGQRSSCVLKPHATNPAYTTTLAGLSLADALAASAAVFALSAARLAEDVAVATLPIEARFFWTTVYFNSGASKGRSVLRKHGVGYYRKKWALADDPEKHLWNTQYNALWRTASLEYLIRTRIDPASRWDVLAVGTDGEELFANIYVQALTPDGVVLGRTDTVYDAHEPAWNAPIALDAPAELLRSGVRVALMSDEEPPVSIGKCPLLMASPYLTPNVIVLECHEDRRYWFDLRYRLRPHCPEGRACDDGPGCFPDCGGRYCGDDGCGGSCGVCALPGLTCVHGVCSDE